MLAALVLAAGTFGLSGCGSTADQAAVADNDLSTNDGDDADDDDQLATTVQCAVELDAVAKLPPAATQSEVTEESVPPEESATEHASLAELYRSQAKDMAASMGKSDADLKLLYSQASEEVERQRKARAPDDFAGWLGGEADSCPALSPDGS